MRKKIKYKDEKIGRIKIVDDFLPPPHELAFKEENVKVTMFLSKSSVEFFKNRAHRYKTQYQKMIRRLVDYYTSHHR